MATDKKDYQTVQISLLGKFTVTSLINKLTKVRVTTEDKHLRHELTTILETLNRVARSSLNPSTIISIDPSDHRYKHVLAYCEQCIASIKPQWQILAEQNQWAQAPGS